MKFDKDKKGLVRGCLKIDDHYRTSEVTAYTFWYRHDDEDVERKVLEDTDRLFRAYQGMGKRWSTASMWLEWKPYRDKDSLYY